eukprot:COSAG02_NODE_346_length_24113_cov_13.213001_20_plen_119_part_00
MGRAKDPLFCSPRAVYGSPRRENHTLTEWHAVSFQALGSGMTGSGPASSASPSCARSAGDNTRTRTPAAPIAQAARVVLYVRRPRRRRRARVLRKLGTEARAGRAGRLMPHLIRLHDR